MDELISREAVFNAINRIKTKRNETWYEFYQKIMTAVGKIPPAEPKRETATVSVGMSKGGVTMWYECEACGEPVDQGDTFCSGCGRKLIHE